MSGTESDSDCEQELSSSFKPFRDALYAMDQEIALAVKGLQKLSHDHEDLYETLKLGKKLQPWLAKWAQEGCLGPSGAWVVLSPEDASSLRLKEGKVAIWDIFVALLGG